MIRLYAIALFCIVAPALADPPGPPGTWQDTVQSQWFARQHSVARVSCCSNADGHQIDDNDWRSANGHYEVRVAGKWYQMPPTIMRDSVNGGPNMTGHALAWYTFDSTMPGGLHFWCFAPGTEF